MPKSRQIGTHHDWCVTVHGREEMLSLKDLAEKWLVEGSVNIAIIGDELTGNDGEHAQAFFKFPYGTSGRGMPYGRILKEIRGAGCVSAHIEPRKSRSINRAGNYCLKEHFEHIAKMFPEKGSVYRPDSKPLLVAGWDVENGRADFPSQGKRNDIDGFKEDVLAGLCKEWDTAMSNHSGLCARAEGFVRQFIGRYSPLQPMSVEEWGSLKSAGVVSRWVGWAIFHLNEPDVDYRYRKVGVLTDCVLNGTGGNTGKSRFCDWYPRLMATFGIKVQVLSPGKLADMAMQLRSDVHQLLIDIPASRSDTLQWSFIEQVKSGRVDSPKYHSCTIVMANRPISVLILCNNHPDKQRRPKNPSLSVVDENDRMKQWFVPPAPEYTLSQDRWVEYEITSEEDLAPVYNFQLPPSLNVPSEYN